MRGSSVNGAAKQRTEPFGGGGLWVIEARRRLDARGQTLQIGARLSSGIRICKRAAIIFCATLSWGASPAWSQTATPAPQSRATPAPEKSRESTQAKPTPPRRPVTLRQPTPPLAAPVAPPPLPKTPPPAPITPAPAVDMSRPPPSLPRASREKMRACAEEWGKMKRETAAGLPMWRDFANDCLTR